MAHEGKVYGNARRAYNTLVLRPENPALRDMPSYAGELLTLERIRISPILKSSIFATVRYDEQTAFEIAVYKPEQALFLQAGYDLPTEVGEHAFSAEVICRFGREPLSRDFSLQIDKVLPKVGGASEPTPLQSQSDIFIRCRRDAKLQKLVKLAECRYDIHGNPFVRIQCYAEHKATIETEVNPMLVKGMVILWSVIERKPFTGGFGTATPQPDSEEDAA